MPWNNPPALIVSKKLIGGWLGRVFWEESAEEKDRIGGDIKGCRANRMRNIYTR